MAHLDTLIDRISDAKLRSEIQEQVNKLSAKTSFGLVFEEHRPETVELPGFEISRGGKVAFKDRSRPGTWVVIHIKDEKATLVRQDDRTERTSATLDELVVIREFGDPIFPGLQSVGRVTRGGDDPFHAVINAENYHAVEMLLYPYEGKVDVIYLDPPYNTGAKDWKYNNDYVDKNDSYRHSKWLSFMEKRLKIAKRLLKAESSVLIVTIDEKECHRLALLLEQVFPGKETQMITTVINPKGASLGGDFSRVEEYIFVVFQGDAVVVPEVRDMLAEERAAGSDKKVKWSSLIRGGAQGIRTDSPGAYFPVFIDVENRKIHSFGGSLPFGTEKESVPVPEGTIAVWPPTHTSGVEGRWGIGPDKARELYAAGALRLGKIDVSKGQFALSYLSSGIVEKIQAGDIAVTGKKPDGTLIVQYQEGLKLTQPKSVWKNPSHNAGEYGSKIISQMLPGRRFPFPKSLYAVEDILRFFVKDNPDALILDFFGGSGTTAHAVMRLNNQDGGNRRSLVVTNNAVSESESIQLKKRGYQPGEEEYEALGIFEYITKPRVTAAVTGLTPNGDPIEADYKFVDEFPMAEGLEANVEFFKLTYEDNQLVRLGRKFEAIAPILWLRAGAHGERIDRLPEAGWSVPKAGYYGLLTDIDQWEPFVDEVNARPDIRCVFIVTDSQAEFEAINVQIDQKIDSVRLYSDYLQTFEINTRQG